MSSETSLHKHLFVAEWNPTLSAAEGGFPRNGIPGARFPAGRVNRVGEFEILATLFVIDSAVFY